MLIFLGQEILVLVDQIREKGWVSHAVKNVLDTESAKACGSRIKMVNGMLMKSALTRVLSQMW